MYLVRRYGATDLKQLVEFLSVKELSTVSHGVRRAEMRLKEDRDFRQTVEKALRSLSHSPMQA